MRRIFQAILYEVIAILIIIPCFSIWLVKPIEVSAILAVLISTIAIAWNIAFNALFEYAESKLYQNKRTLYTRAIHAIGFEGGLTAITTPLIAYEFNLSLCKALLIDIWLTLFFVVYAFAFHVFVDMILNNQYRRNLSSCTLSIDDQPFSKGIKTIN